MRALLIFIAQILGGIAAAAVVSGLFPGPLNVSTTLNGTTSIARGLCKLTGPHKVAASTNPLQSLRCSSLPNSSSPSSCLPLRSTRALSSLPLALASRCLSLSCPVSSLQAVRNLNYRPLRCMTDIKPRVPQPSPLLRSMRCHWSLSRQPLALLARTFPRCLGRSRILPLDKDTRVRDRQPRPGLQRARGRRFRVR